MRKRMISLAAAFAVALCGALGRCGYIAFDNAYAADSSYNSISLEIAPIYTDIYSSDKTLLNNISNAVYALIKPNEKALSELSLLFGENTVKSITEELSNGYPVVVPIEKYAKTKYIRLVEASKRDDDNMLCRHMISAECGGLEYYEGGKIGSLCVNYSVNALGKVLDGDDGTLTEKRNGKSSITVSINSDIQKIAEKCAESLDRGCVAVLDVKTSKVLASVSLGGDYLNRAVQPYAVGSVFKLVVAAAAVENNINPRYVCNGSITVGDSTFNCQNKNKHGSQNIKQALANSCNCYFVNLAEKLGKKKLVETADKLGFGEEYSLYGSFTVPAASFPSESELSSKGQLALLGFGQGKLTDTPLHFAAVVAAIANNGSYAAPTLKTENTSKTQAFSAETAEKLCEYMHFVVTDGTGKNADYNGETAGKTATAQSGVYDGETEQLNTWFAGFYPYENPEYAIVVMREGGESGAGDCCPIFYSLVAKLSKL